MPGFDPLQLYSLLLDAYGPQGWWPLYSRRGEGGFDERGYRTGAEPDTLSRNESFEIILGAILTQNTNWQNVERALKRLFDAGIDSPEALIATNEERLAELIRPSGYFRQKSARLLDLIPRIFPDGRLNEFSREELLALKGIGPETADSILLYVCGRSYFIADLYTRRLKMRLAGAEKIGKYEEVRSAFESQLPNKPSLYREFHALIIRHGKAHCAARPCCEGCPALVLCEYPNRHDA